MSAQDRESGRDLFGWLAFAGLAALAALLHHHRLASLVAWVPRPFGDGLVPVLLAGLVVAQGLVTLAPVAVRAHVLVAAWLVLGALVSVPFTAGGAAWALLYRRVLWSGARPAVTLGFPLVTLLALLVAADAAHLPALSAAHPWLWVVTMLFTACWFLRALVVWQEARSGAPRPRAVDFLGYFLFAPFVVVPSYMLALPKLALVTDGVRRLDRAVVRSGLRWLAYGLGLQLVVALVTRAGLEPRALFIRALVEREWALAAPLLFVYYPGWAVLTAVGGGALLVGLARVFGVAMAPAFRAPLLARGVTDWWRRYNTHFRDLLVDLFWYPIALRFRRRPVLAACLGAGAVFLLGSVPLHWPSSAAANGSLRAFPWHTAAESVVMAVLVGTGLVLDRRRRGPASGPWSVGAWAHRLLTWLLVCFAVVVVGYQARYRLHDRPWQRVVVQVERVTTPAEAAALLPALTDAVEARPRVPARRAALARMLALAGERAAACAELRFARAFSALATEYDLLALAQAERAAGAACTRPPP